MPRRIDLGRAVLVGGAVLLFISLFLKWYDNGLTGWQVFEALDLLLTALAAVAIYLALAADDVPAPVAIGVPLAAAVIVFVQLVNDPPAAAGADPSTGAWLALAGAALMLAGTAFALTSISVTVEVGERSLRRRVAAVDRRATAERAGGATGTAAAAPSTTVTPPKRATPPGPTTDPDDLERTQPLSAISEDDDEERPGRP